MSEAFETTISGANAGEHNLCTQYSQGLLKRINDLEEQNHTAARRALEAEATVERLRAALKRYGVHERYVCELEENCSCGLDAAQAAEDAPGEGAG